jgi:hypothetical protein
MSNLTPFEIRLELLKMAKEMLAEDYYAKREQVSNNWQVKVDNARQSGATPPDHPGLPTYPSEQDIITKAQSLNIFVSNLPPNESKKKTS